jgi:hypothetical protein
VCVCFISQKVRADIYNFHLLNFYYYYLRVTCVSSMLNLGMKSHINLILGCRMRLLAQQEEKNDKDALDREKGNDHFG